LLKYYYLTLILLSPVTLANTPHDQSEKTIAQVIELLVAQGFYDISKVEFDHDDNRYEIKARNTNNEKVEIELTTTGQFISVEED
jgi:hypothetical protein